MRGHSLENGLVSLSPRNFDSLQVYFSKFKALVLQLKQCGIVIMDLVVAFIDESNTGWQRGHATKAMTNENPNPQKMDGCHVG